MVIAEHKILNDSHPYLIALLEAVQNGYEMPEQITKEQYYDVKANPDRDMALTGFVDLVVVLVQSGGVDMPQITQEQTMLNKQKIVCSEK